MANDSLEDVYVALGAVMRANIDGLVVIEEGPQKFSVESTEVGKNGKPRWFGAVQTKKNYVSYHLMPVYENPTLLTGISDELRARMQGKSCFNFKAVDEDLFAQLGALTKTGTTDFGS